MSEPRDNGRAHFKEVSPSFAAGEAWSELTLCGRKSVFAWYGPGQERWVTCPDCRRLLADRAIREAAGSK